MTKMALCVAVLSASSYLVVPLPFTPVVLSLHSVAVGVTGLILSLRQAVCALSVYLLMGLMGLPVFAGGTAGPGKLFGPTGGFYFGFLLAAAAISALKGRQLRFGRCLLVTAGVGLPLQHLCAVAFFWLHNGRHLPSAFLTASLPFLPGDLVKCVLAATIGVSLNKALQKL